MKLLSVVKTLGIVAVALALPHNAESQNQVPTCLNDGANSTAVSAGIAAGGVSSKAPIIPSIQAPYTQPFLPSVPMAQYLATKSVISQFSQSSFTQPPAVQPVGPRAPSTPPPITGTPTVGWPAIADTQFQPPSPDLAVGPTDAVMVVNSTIAQFDKSGTLIKSTNFFDWFTGVLPTVCPFGAANCLIYDPAIRYDQIHGRFLFLATATSWPDKTHSNLLISVSNGATFDSGWKIWALDATLDGSTRTANWADSWRIGYDSVAVYLSGNMFSSIGNFQYAKIRVLKKSDLFNPNTSVLRWQEISQCKNANGTIASSLMPAIMRGKPTTTRTPYFVNAADPPSLPASFLTVWKFADPLADSPVISGYTVSGLLPYFYPAPAPQLGGIAPLDSGDSRVLKVVYRNGFLYTARDTGYTDQATTVTFDVIDTSNISGAFSNLMGLSSQARLVNTNAFYPAFDVPPTIATSAPFATANLITGTTTAADGSLTYAGISRVKAGEGYFDIVQRPARWGDYFEGAVDPVAGGLWVSGEYALPPNSGFGQWNTWAAYFPWVTQPVFNDVDNTSFFADYINVLRLWSVTLGCVASPPLYCPTDQVTRGQMAAFLVRAIVGSDTFPFSNIPYYNDVPPTHPFFSYIQKLHEFGVPNNCGTNLYCPDAAITRSDMALFVIRTKMNFLFGDNFTYPTTPYFTDVPSTDDKFKFIQKMREMGITSGCTATTYCPTQNLTRQEMAVFLTRAFLN